MILFLLGFGAGISAMVFILWGCKADLDDRADYWYENSDKWMQAYLRLRDGGDGSESDG